jgi:hypothetical protein
MLDGTRLWLGAMVTIPADVSVANVSKRQNFKGVQEVEGSENGGTCSTGYLDREFGPHDSGHSQLQSMEVNGASVQPIRQLQTHREVSFDFSHGKPLEGRRAL